MSEPVPVRPAPYELRVPAGGLGQPHPQFALLMWGVGSIALGVTVSVLLVQGQYRALVLVLLSFLGLISLAPRRGVYILTAFLPFMYYIRRSVLSYEEFSTRDPILLFPVITTMVMVLGIVIFYGPQLYRYVWNSLLLKVCIFLMVWLSLEIFNPLQGNFLVGVAGGMIFIIPMLWVVFGLITPSEDMARILKMMLVIGCITSLYGIYQRYFGLTDVELYELQAKHFLKTFAGSLSEVRVMSTFAGLPDFSRYLSVSVFLAFAYFWRTRRALFMLVLIPLQLYAMLFTAMRTAFLVTFFSVIMLVIMTGGRARRVGARAMGALVIVMILYSFMYRYDARTIYSQRFSGDPFVVHTLSGITHPTEEGSFQTRLESWGFIVVSALTQFPVGHGLGSTTPAASKFEGGQFYEADSYFFELFYGSGLVAPILFIALLFILIRIQLKLSLDSPDEYLYKICFGLTCGVLLASFFGVALRDNILGPTAWLIIGWIIKEDVDRRVGTGAPSAAERTQPLTAIQRPGPA